jgi:hypothetical protein
MDSRNTPKMNFDSVATETPLGVLLKHKISDKEAQEIISNFEFQIIPILNRIKEAKKPNAKIAITFPKIKNQKVDVVRICEKTRLKLKTNPIEESRPKQFISREILVFE